MVNSENLNDKRCVKWEWVGNILKVSEDSTKAETEKRFTFEVLRFKDEVSHSEFLKIKSTLDGKDNGEVEADISDLSSAFRTLRTYGVVLDENMIKQIQGMIEDKYLDLPPIPFKTSEDDKFTDFLNELGLYFSMEEEDNTPELCYIPVGDFDSTALECGYKSFELTELRRLLSDKKFIRTTSSNRFSTLVRYKKKPTRVITFYRDKMKKYIPESKKTNETPATKEQ